MIILNMAYIYKHYARITIMSLCDSLQILQCIYRYTNVTAEIFNQLPIERMLGTIMMMEYGISVIAVTNATTGVNTNLAVYMLANILYYIYIILV